LLAELSQTRPGAPPGATGLAAAACAGLSFLAGVAALEGAGMAVGAEIAGAGAGMDGYFVPVVEGADSAGVEAAGTGVADKAYQVCTPLCPRHAPDLLAAVE
jgi:hypothetical protein